MRFNRSSSAGNISSRKAFCASLLAVSGRPLRVADGILADVGPTLLHLLGLPRPPEMTGRTIVDWA